MIHHIRVSKRALLQAISTCHSHKCARHSTQSELTAPTLTKDNICIIGGHKVRALRNDNGRTTIQHPQFYTHKSVAGRISLISAKCPVRRDDDSGGIFFIAVISCLPQVQEARRLKRLSSHKNIYSIQLKGQLAHNSPEQAHLFPHR